MLEACEKEGENSHPQRDECIENPAKFPSYSQVCQAARERKIKDHTAYAVVVSVGPSSSSTARVQSHVCLNLARMSFAPANFFSPSNLQPSGKVRAAETTL
jgi:hypothetical protein